MLFWSKKIICTKVCLMLGMTSCIIKPTNHNLKAYKTYKIKLIFSCFVELLFYFIFLISLYTCNHQNSRKKIIKQNIKGCYAPELLWYDLYTIEKFYVCFVIQSSKMNKNKNWNISILQFCYLGYTIEACIELMRKLHSILRKSTFFFDSSKRKMGCCGHYHAILRYFIHFTRIMS